jgi:hypothetical protein
VFGDQRAQVVLRHPLRAMGQGIIAGLRSMVAVGGPIDLERHEESKHTMLWHPVACLLVTMFEA